MFKRLLSATALTKNSLTDCDVLIIGGGGVGSSIAYWIKKTVGPALNVIVVEKDSTYAQSSTALSVGGVRQQFSLVENIEMSLYGSRFIRNIKEYLGPDVDVNYMPHGYLMLATDEGAECLQKNSLLQNSMGAKNVILNSSKLKETFPWLNTNGIALGCYGLEKEGWFDPWALMMGYKNKAKQLGTHYISGEVKSFNVSNTDIVDNTNLKEAHIRMENDTVQSIRFKECVIAAGALSGQVGKMANLGRGEGLLSTELPVEPRKRYVYVIECNVNDCPGHNTPLTIDPNHTYFRKDGMGKNFLCGRSPDPKDEPCISELTVDYDYFDNEVWPRLAHRVPAFESIKLKNAWAGYYEYNTVDANGIIGRHPYYRNLLIATGFSGHGIQQTPAVGRAISELIINGKFKTIDLSRLGFERFINNTPMHEVNIV